MTQEPHSLPCEQSPGKPDVINSMGFTIFRQVCFTAGLILSFYLGLLKLVNIPCPTGGCWGVLQSSYGSMLGIPVGLFGTVAWLLLFQRSHAVTLGRLMLLVGSVYFLAIQAFVLHSFCLWCTFHAICAIILSVWPVVPASASLLVLPIVAMLVGVQASPKPAQAPVGPAPTVRIIPAKVGPQTLETSVVPHTTRQMWFSAQQYKPSGASNASPATQWLGPSRFPQSTLVISFTCGHCMDTLWPLLRGSLPRPPKLMFLTGEGNRVITEHVMAAIILAGDDQPAFYRILLGLEATRDELLTGNLEKIKTVLQKLAPGYTSKLPVAAELLARQNNFLKPLNLAGTPYLILANGSGTYGLDPTKF